LSIKKRLKALLIHSFVGMIRGGGMARWPQGIFGGRKGVQSEGSMVEEVTIRFGENQTGLN